MELHLLQVLVMNIKVISSGFLPIAITSWALGLIVQLTGKAKQ